MWHRPPLLSILIPDLGLTYTKALSPHQSIRICPPVCVDRLACIHISSSFQSWRDKFREGISEWVDCAQYSALFNSGMNIRASSKTQFIGRRYSVLFYGWLQRSGPDLFARTFYNLCIIQYIACVHLLYAYWMRCSSAERANVKVVASRGQGHTHWASFWVQSTISIRVFRTGLRISPAWS